MPPQEIPVPAGESAFSLVERDIPEPVKLCDPWAIEGLNILAGRPKLGKTTLERQKLAAAATAAPFLDSAFANAVQCAFLCLEEGEGLCRSKFKVAGFTDAALASIQLHFTWPRGDDGVDLLDRYLAGRPEVRFVVVDSLTRFRAVPDARHPAFMNDYDAVNGLQELSKRHPGIVIDVIHHTRKAKSDDAIDDVSGTYGLTAACDSITVLRHQGDGAIMHVYGRLWMREANEYKIARSAGRWLMLGENLGLSDEQMETLELVKKAAEFGLSGASLGQRLGITTQSAWDRLDGLLAKGFVSKKFGKVYPK
jgi:biotin operon repressor